ncbi:creatininase family protein [Streptomyces johnsoniae]|uniref:Creatininase family protein n=1 Tax=Streptomyces johnsoniae TaxID=3075532 RepID=A0ABU2S4C7_9ACTN|nr:creatininase family protein [Streptomyces sp. DSM 41886]MDT0443837.1 creatininase family protein [Streptomyces sp. DSM 41886]
MTPAPDGDVLAGTVAELTWGEVARAAREGAVLLWAFGVIEQHGPHLPAGTDVYLPSAWLRAVRVLLAERGVRALIVPPYYWGVNVVSAGFPASWSVRPAVMTEVMADVFAGLAGDGFRHVFCFSGHGDALHNRTVHAGVLAGRERCGVDATFVMEPGLADRLGPAPGDPAVTVLPPTAAPARGGPPDLHAGREETSLMLAGRRDLVRTALLAGLPPTDLGPREVAAWRRGHEHARSVTPDGYLGDPAAACAAHGRTVAADAAERAAHAITERLRRAAA